MKQPVFRSLGACALVGLLAALGSRAARAADHRDSPNTAAFPAADLTDIYAFRSPENSNNLVVIINVDPRLLDEPRVQYFSNDVKYILHVVTCRSSGLTPDLDVVTTFSGNGFHQTFSVAGLTGSPLTGPVNQIVTAGAIKVFCGSRDDPFFFDLDAFKHFLAGPYVPTEGLRRDGDETLPPPAQDFFAGSDVASIVLEFPISALPGCTGATGTMKAWAETQRAILNEVKSKSLTSPIR